MRRCVRVLASTGTVALAGCSLLTSLDGLSGGANEADVRGREDAAVGPASPDASSDAALRDVAIDAATATTCTAPDLVARWTFDEGSGAIVRDCTAGAHDGVAAGGYSWGAGHAGGAMTLAGTGGIDIGATLRPSAPFTLSAWINVSAVAYSYILSRHESGAKTGYRLALEADGRISLSVCSGSGCASVTSSNAASVAAWTHVAATYEPGTSMRVYVDGVQSGSLTTGVPVLVDDVATTFSIGCDAVRTQSIAAALDDARIYSRALAPAEINQLAQ